MSYANEDVHESVSTSVFGYNFNVAIAFFIKLILNELSFVRHWSNILSKFVQHWSNICVRNSLFLCLIVRTVKKQQRWKTLLFKGFPPKCLSLRYIGLFLNSSLGRCYAYLIFNGERAFCNSFVSFRPILNFCMPDIQ